MCPDKVIQVEAEKNKKDINKFMSVLDKQNFGTNNEKEISEIVESCESDHELVEG